MAATLPTKSVSHPSSPSPSDTGPEEDSHPIKNPHILQLQPLVPSPPGREKRRPKKRPHRPNASSAEIADSNSSDSDDGEFPADETGRPGLEHESESEDLEMSDYPHTGDEGEARVPTPDRNKGGKRRRRGGLNPRGGGGGGGGAGVGLGDRLVMADGDRPVISDEEKKIADGKVLREMAINALFIGLW